METFNIQYQTLTKVARFVSFDVVHQQKVKEQHGVAQHGVMWIDLVLVKKFFVRENKKEADY